MSLRKIAAAVVVGTCLVASAAVAQKGKLGGTPGWTIGPVAGVNIATFTGTDATDAKSLTGLAAGVAASRELAPSIFIQPEALYSMKGASYSSGGVTAKAKLNYLEVPVLFGYSFATGGQTRPFIMAGPTLGALLSCNYEETSAGVTQSASCKDLGVDTRSLDLGITGGAGVEFPVGNMTLQLSGRYTLGLTEPIDGAKLKNSGFNISAGLMFPLRR